VLLEGVRDHFLFPIVYVALATGARRDEILALRWSDIDFEKGLVRIDRAIEETQAHGVKFNPQKTESSRRLIGVDADVISTLRKHRAYQLEEHLKLGTRLPPDALVFPQSALAPATPMATFRVSKRFSDLAKRIGFPKLRFHDLRHTHATLLLTEGVPVNAVAARLAHSKASTTINCYGHALKRAEEQAASVAGSILRDAMNSGPK